MFPYDVSSSYSDEESYDDSPPEDYYYPSPHMRMMQNELHDLPQELKTSGKYFTSPNFTAGSKRHSGVDEQFDGPSLKKLRNGGIESDKYPKLSDDAIRNYTTQYIFESGKKIWSANVVSSIILHPEQSQLHAHLSGTVAEQKIMEKVKISFTGGAIIGATCTCTVEGRRAYFYCCQHTVAVLLTCAADPTAVVSVDDIRQKIVELSRDDLNELTVTLITQYGGLDFLKNTRPSEKQTRSVSADKTDTIFAKSNSQNDPFKKTIQDELVELAKHTPSYYADLSDGSEDNDDEGDDMMRVARGLDREEAYRLFHAMPKVKETVTKIISKSRALAKDPLSSETLVGAAATTEEIARVFESLNLKPKALLRALGDLLNSAWVDLFLEFPLAASDRPSWVSRVQQWSKKFNGAPFTDAETVAKFGWDHPDLQKILKGEKDVKFTETAIITAARFSFLEKNGRTEEAINLTRAMGSGTDRNNRVLEDLLMAGRVDDAVEEALKNCKNIEEAYSLGKRVRESHPLGAFKLVKKALDLTVSERDDYYYRARPISTKELVLWLCNHAHECDVFMKTTGGAMPTASQTATAASSLSSSSAAKGQHNLVASPARSRSLADIVREQEEKLMKRRLGLTSKSPIPIEDEFPGVVVTTPNPIIPSLYDMCMNVIGEDYAENMNAKEQKELEDEMPITMQASLMMEMAVNLAMMHLRVEEQYQIALFLQSKDRQFMALRLCLRALNLAASDQQNEPHPVYDYYGTPVVSRKVPPPFSLRLWLIKNAIASNHSGLIEKAVQGCAVAYTADDPFRNLALCRFLQSKHREQQALSLAMSTLEKTRPVESTRAELVEYICSILATYTTDALVAYAIHVKETKKPPLAIQFGIAKLLYQRGNHQEGFDLALDCLDIEEEKPRDPYHSHYPYNFQAPRRSTAKRDCAKWIASVAEDLHQQDKALKALIVLAKADPTIENYKRAKDLALKTSEPWESIRTEILAAIKDSPVGAVDKLEIFISENRTDLVMDLLKTPSMKLFKIAGQALDKYPDMGKPIANRLMEYLWREVWLSNQVLAYSRNIDVDSGDDFAIVWDTFKKYLPKETANRTPTAELRNAFIDISNTARMVNGLQANATAYGRLLAALKTVYGHYVRSARPKTEWAAVLRIIRDKHSKKGKLFGMIEATWKRNEFDY